MTATKREYTLVADPVTPPLRGVGIDSGDELTLITRIPAATVESLLRQGLTHVSHAVSETVDGLVTAEARSGRGREHEPLPRDGAMIARYPDPPIDKFTGLVAHRVAPEEGEGEADPSPEIKREGEREKEREKEEDEGGVLLSSFLPYHVPDLYADEGRCDEVVFAPPYDLRAVHGRWVVLRVPSSGARGAALDYLRSAAATGGTIPADGAWMTTTRYRDVTAALNAELARARSWRAVREAVAAKYDDRTFWDLFAQTAEETVSVTGRAPEIRLLTWAPTLTVLGPVLRDDGGLYLYQTSKDAGRTWQNAWGAHLTVVPADSSSNERRAVVEPRSEHALVMPADAKAIGDGLVGVTRFHAPPPATPGSSIAAALEGSRPADRPVGLPYVSLGAPLPGDSGTYALTVRVAPPALRVSSASMHDAPLQPPPARAAAAAAAAEVGDDPLGDRAPSAMAAVTVLRVREPVVAEDVAPTVPIALDTATVAPSAVTWARYRWIDEATGAEIDGETGPTLSVTLPRNGDASYEARLTSADGRDLSVRFEVWRSVWCQRCREMYRPGQNHPTACRWHTPLLTGHYEADPETGEQRWVERRDGTTAMACGWVAPMSNGGEVSLAGDPCPYWGWACCRAPLGTEGCWTDAHMSTYPGPMLVDTLANPPSRGTAWRYNCRTSVRERDDEIMLAYLDGRFEDVLAREYWFNIMRGGRWVDLALIPGAAEPARRLSEAAIGSVDERRAAKGVAKAMMNAGRWKMWQMPLPPEDVPVRWQAPAPGVVPAVDAMTALRKEGDQERIVRKMAEVARAIERRRKVDPAAWRAAAFLEMEREEKGAPVVPIVQAPGAPPAPVPGGGPALVPPPHPTTLPAAPSWGLVPAVSVPPAFGSEREFFVEYGVNHQKAVGLMTELEQALRLYDIVITPTDKALSPARELLERARKVLRVTPVRAALAAIVAGEFVGAAAADQDPEEERKRVEEEKRQQTLKELRDIIAELVEAKENTISATKFAKDKERELRERAERQAAEVFDKRWGTVKDPVDRKLMQDLVETHKAMTDRTYVTSNRAISEAGLYPLNMMQKVVTATTKVPKPPVDIKDRVRREVVDSATTDIEYKPLLSETYGGLDPTGGLGPYEELDPLVEKKIADETIHGLIFRLYAKPLKLASSTFSNELDGVLEAVRRVIPKTATSNITDAIWKVPDDRKRLDETAETLRAADIVVNRIGDEGIKSDVRDKRAGTEALVAQFNELRGNAVDAIKDSADAVIKGITATKYPSSVRDLRKATAQHHRRWLTTLDPLRRNVDENKRTIEQAATFTAGEIKKIKSTADGYERAVKNDPIFVVESKDGAVVHTDYWPALTTTTAVINEADSPGVREAALQIYRTEGEMPAKQMEGIKPLTEATQKAFVHKIANNDAIKSALGLKKTYQDQDQDEHLRAYIGLNVIWPLVNILALRQAGDMLGESATNVPIIALEKDNASSFLNDAANEIEAIAEAKGGSDLYRKIADETKIPLSAAASALTVRDSARLADTAALFGAGDVSLTKTLLKKVKINKGNLLPVPPILAALAATGGGGGVRGSFVDALVGMLMDKL